MNTKINNKGFASILFFISQTMFLGVGIPQILSSSNQSSPISVVLGTIFGLSILYLLLKLYNYEKDLNLFQKNEKLFGKVLGNLINFFLVVIMTLFFIYTLWSLEIYIQNKYLDKTPSIIIIIIFLLPVVYSVNKGIKAISKTSMIIFIISVIEIVLCIFGLTNLLEIDNLKPFFTTPTMTIVKDSLNFASYFLIPAFVMLIIPKNKIENSYKLDKYMLIYYLFGCINLFLLITFIIGIFGIEYAKLFYYPEFTLIKKINYFDFITHVENILSSQWLFSLYITAVMNLLFVKEYMNYKKSNKKFIYYIFIILCLIGATIIFENTTIGYNIAKKYFNVIYSLPILLLLIISLIVITLKRNKQK